MEIETNALEEKTENKSHEKTEKETESTNPRDTVNFWKKWIKSAKKAGERHASETRDAWREYEGSSISVTNSIVETTKEKESYPIYWASVKTLEPAYYSRTPKITSKRTFDVEDETARVASILVERLGSFLVENSNFDSAMQSAVLDFIHGDKATVQVNYSVEIIEDNNRINLYEVQSEQGDTVYIRTRPTIETFRYKKGMALPVQNPESPYVALKIDQGEGFSFALDKIDEFQSDIKLMNVWGEDAAKQMQ